MSRALLSPYCSVLQREHCRHVFGLSLNTSKRRCSNVCGYLHFGKARLRLTNFRIGAQILLRAHTSDFMLRPITPGRLSRNQHLARWRPVAAAIDETSQGEVPRSA
jgi:hypothetical protein